MLQYSFLSNNFKNHLSLVVIVDVHYRNLTGRESLSARVGHFGMTSTARCSTMSWSKGSGGSRGLSDPARSTGLLHYGSAVGLRGRTKRSSRSCGRLTTLGRSKK